MSQSGPVLFATLPTVRPPVMGSKYVVSSGHYLASLAGIRILDMGGNVVDAGVAAGLCVNVLQPDLTSMGGVAPIMLYLAKPREVVTISGLGRWPKAATLEELRRRGADLSPGILTSVVPSALDAWIVALDRYGTMRFADVAAPAIELADRGFPVNRFLHNNLSKHAQKLAQWPSSRSVFLSRGRAPAVGERLVQRELANTLRVLVEAETSTTNRHEGLMAVRSFFYSGEIARQMVRFCRQMGGLLDDTDFAEFSVKVEPPVKTTYRGYEVYACGPWCQGPVVLEALNILEGYDLGVYPHNSKESLHLITEALKAAFADRHAYYGDPEFVDVPIRGLLSKNYASSWRDRIRMDRAFLEMPQPGNPWAYQQGTRTGHSIEAPVPSPGPDSPDTSYICVVDIDGNAFSATPSDGALETPLVPGLGMIISDRGRQAWLDPDHASCVAPGKRPRLTPSPGLILRDHQLFTPYGTPGNDVQPQAMTQLALNLIDYGLDVQEAIEAPRIASYSFPGSVAPHPYNPGLLQAESRIPQEVLEALAGLGHRVEPWPAWTPYAGALCAVVMDPENRTLMGGADPRRLAYAIGW